MRQLYVSKFPRVLLVPSSPILLYLTTRSMKFVQK